METKLVETTDNLDNGLFKIQWVVLLSAGIIAFILSWSVLSGDQQGMVNLLYLLFIFLFIPVAGLLISVVSLFSTAQFHFSKLLYSLPILWNKTNNFQRKLHQLKLDKYWFLYQSQIAALTFSVMSLTVYFVLLLSTDINFIWRSTILEASDLFPVLEMIASPWSFWSTAQPELVMLEATKDSRLMSMTELTTAHSRWWKFILAVQLVYGVIPRLLMLFVCRLRLIKQTENDFEKTLLNKIKKQTGNAVKPETSLSILHELPSLQYVNNRDNIPNNILTAVNSSLDINSLKQLGVDDEIPKEKFLVLVKAWEPPLGELEDYLQKGQGLVLPLDWKFDVPVKIKSTHLLEWQRFINKLPNWQLFLPEELTP